MTLPDALVPDHLETPDAGWRDAAEVGPEATQAAWTAAAREELLETARRYHEVTTQKELAAAVQERSGIHTTRAMHHWIGGVLDGVTRECVDRDEPLLSALCVNAGGSVGEDYARAVPELTGATLADLDDQAAAQRLQCYRLYDAVGLPTHGGTKALTPQLAAARARARKKYHAEKPANVCPTCQMAMPATGLCDSCD